MVGADQAIGGTLFKMRQKFGHIRGTIVVESFHNVVADSFDIPEVEEEDLEKRLERKKEEIEIKNNMFHEADKKVSVTDSKLSEKIKQLKEELGKEEPLEKEEIHTTDFEAEINRLKHSKRELLKIEKQLETRAGIISGNLTALQEYRDFLITKPIVWQEDFETMDEKSLRELSGSLKRDYRNICDEKDKKRRRIT